MRVVLHGSSKKYPSIQHIDEFALHLVIYLAVTCESAAAVSKAGQRGDEVGILYLLVKVADE